jgi:hypothetical protein
MEFKQPVVVYTAATNVEAHMVVEMLHANGVAAHAVEDQSGVSLWAFGTISQFHQPNVWVDQSTAEKASLLIRRFEENKRERENPGTGAGEIHVECEECGKTTIFPDTLNGTTQDCSHCHAYVDVGDLPWSEDFGEPDE